MKSVGPTSRYFRPIDGTIYVYKDETTPIVDNTSCSSSPSKT
jgi:hypothetical protein